MIPSTPGQSLLGTANVPLVLLHSWKSTHSCERRSAVELSERTNSKMAKPQKVDMPKLPLSMGFLFGGLAGT